MGRLLRFQSARKLGPSPKCPICSNVPACTSPCQKSGGRSLQRRGPRQEGGAIESIECWGGRRGLRMCSDTGGGLCSRLLFTVPQPSGLLLVADAHLLRDVNQRAGHRQTCTHTHTKTSQMDVRTHGATTHNPVKMKWDKNVLIS